MEQVIRILMFEDSPEDAELIRREIVKSGIYFVARVVSRCADFVKGLEAFSPDVILCDNDLPDTGGKTALYLARKHLPETPFILVTGSITDEAAAEILAQGATDYVLKDRRSRLGPAIRRALAEAEERTRRARVEEAMRRREAQITHNALHDTLTGLATRRGLVERLAVALPSSGSAKPFALLLLDVDHFKHVNDSLGHDAGDRLLAAVAEKLRALAGTRSTTARLGEDEFAVLVEGRGEAGEAIAFGEQIQRELLLPTALGDGDISVQVSIGVVLGPGPYTNPEEILRDADTALYRAKDLGRARVQLFDPSMHERAQAVLRTQTDLRHALARREFRILYQPIVRLGTNVLSGCEALLRWHHPQRGLVPPSEFIPIAEATGDIVPIGEWVLREACIRAQSWEGLGAVAPTVAVNLSARQFRERGLGRAVERILHETGLAPQRLNLEVTETAIMDDVDEAAGIVSRLRGIGVGFALDDFGTGHSSLSYVKRFPLSDLKIDRSFVNEVTTNAEAAAIASAVVSLGHSLDLTVIAEGIETEDQRRYLRGLRCDAGQGYHLGRPMPGDAIESLLRAERQAS